MFGRAGLKSKPNQGNQRKSNKTGPSAQSNSRNVRSASQNSKAPRQYHAGHAPVYSDIESVIQEYLEKRGLTHTLEVFNDEVNLAPPNKKQDDGHNLEAEAQIIELFDKGQRDVFFQKWNKFVPLQVRQKDEECKKLEFYLFVYFVVFGAHENKKSQKSLDSGELQKFKHYLDTKGAELAKTSEFLPYYALPYVQNPMEHPSFRHIFTQDWIIEVRQRLVSFVANFEDSGSAPLLLQMYHAYNQGHQGKGSGPGSDAGNNGNKSMEISEYRSAISQLENSNKELMNIVNQYNVSYDELMRNYNILEKNEEIARANLFESHSKWINFAKELLTISKDVIKMIDNVRNGGQVQNKVVDILKSKISNYESFLNSNIEDLISQSQDHSALDKFSTSQDAETPDYSAISPHSNYTGQNFRNVAQSQIGQSFFPLNYEEIAQALTLGNNENVLCALLQALRWRITRTRAASIRREVIITYAKHDLLGLAQDNDPRLERMLNSTSQKIRAFSGRLINALASDYSGRSYLLETEKMVHHLIKVLKTELGDTIVRWNSLGALQKLSLRRHPQVIMIENDLVKWTIDILKNEKDSLGEYSYEYATALFMNLSLRSLGKNKCEESKAEVLAVFNDLLEHENSQVRTFVNGTLYSLLSRPALKEQAKAMGMNEVLDYLMDNSDDRFKKQIQYIKGQLNSDKTEDDAASDANEDENDVDDIDNEEDAVEEEEIEDAIEDPNLIIGEELLKKHFSLTGQEAMRQTTMVQEAVEESKTVRESRLNQSTHTQISTVEEPLNRPVTPSMLNKMYGDDQNKDLPPELQYRPKVPRTPLGSDKSKMQRLIKSHGPPSENRQSFNEMKVDTENPPKENLDIQVEKSDTKVVEQKSEFDHAFNSRPRVNRTPPNANETKGLYPEDNQSADYSAYYNE